MGFSPEYVMLCCVAGELSGTVVELSFVGSWYTLHKFMYGIRDVLK
jgi:hypothetical protein